MPAGLPRAARLLRPVDFSRVYGHRQSAAGGPLVVYCAPNFLPERPVRLGLSVSRRVGSAVVRNSWKRRLREAFRLRRPGFPAGTDLVIVVRGGPPPAGAAEAGEIAALLMSLAARVTQRRGYHRMRDQQRPPDGRRR